ncbi:MAG: hypothetical protein OZSIB_0376 [Candidatus Ozemobacter sibiricus]|uniref:Uncharacterized protein n=1 Tax=Candidatus Ozemobacter sibiricus TaxID=2268124 RepID=A0A367ZLP4_9BACT|nr:MAG: hypothetical protein OZSIB_0376 [Candidatus Ozemobacter sibiricus]
MSANTPRHAFTLTEVMVGVMLGSLVMGVAMGFWSQAQRNIAQTSTRQILQREARTIIMQLTADLKAVKANTFKTTPEPLTLEFQRFVSEDQDGEEKLAADRTQTVRYTFGRPVLRRILAGKAPRTLSTNVDAITITKQNLSPEEAEKNPNLQARVDVVVRMKMRIPGMKKDEIHVERTSVILRDDYYQLANKHFASSFQLGNTVKDPLDTAEKCVWFDDALGKDDLKNLTKEQIDDLTQVQKDSIKQVNEDLQGLNDQIKKVDTGHSWWAWLTGEDPDVAEVTALRDELRKIECPDRDIPPKGSGNRASEQADRIIKELDERIKRNEKEFFDRSFAGKTIYNENDPAQKARAQAQKKAYEMKLVDRQIEKAMANLSEEDKKDPEKMKQFTKMIDKYPATEAELRSQLERELANANMSPEEKAALIDEKCTEMRLVKTEYANCDLTWMESAANQDKVKAYEAAKQIYNFGKSKVENLRMKEMAIDNLKNLEDARKEMASTKG